MSKNLLTTNRQSIIAFGLMMGFLMFFVITLLFSVNQFLQVYSPQPKIVDENPIDSAGVNQALELLDISP